MPTDTPEDEDDTDVDEAADEQAVAEAASDEAGTASARFRWKWLSTYTSLGVLLAWFVLAVTGAMSDVPGNARGMLNLAFGMALIYALGADTLAAWNEAKSGGGGSQ